MAVKTPIRTVFDGSGNATGLAEYQSGEFIGLTHGGLGASLSIGTTGQVLKVSSGGALEFGSVEALVNIDGATDLTGNTLVTTDQLLASDGGTEGRITLAQVDTLFTSTTQTLSNKTIDSDSNTLTLDLGEGTLTGTFAELNTAVQDATLVSTTGTETLTTKTIDADNNTITNIGPSELSNTAVTPSTYGSATSIPVITVDQQGRLTSASTQAISTTLSIADDSSTSSNIALGSDTLTFIGGTGISSSIDSGNNTVSVGFNFSDGTDGQILSTNGSGTFSFIDFSNVSTFVESTQTIVPAADGNFDLAKIPAQTGGAETPFEVSAPDAFGVALSALSYSLMDPVGSTETVDLGAFA